MKQYKSSISALLIAGAMTLGTAVTANASDITPPPQLSSLINNGMVEVVESFKHDSLTGWLVENQGEYHLYWATADNYVIAGPLIDQTGINLTSKYLAAKKPSPNYDDLYSDFKKNATIVATKPERVEKGSKGALYVFVEPYCGWCSKLEADLEPAIAAGLDVRFVPVAFLNARSGDVIEHILTSENPAQAMVEHRKLKESRQQVNTKPITNATREQIEQNSEFMRKFGIRGTPGLVYEQEGNVRIGGYMKGAQLNQLVRELSSQ